MILSLCNSMCVSGPNVGIGCAHLSLFTLVLFLLVGMCFHIRYYHRKKNSGVVSRHVEE